MVKRSEKGIFRYKDVIYEDDGTLTIGGVKGVPDISGNDLGEVAAWFLGPRAENREVLIKLIQLALNITIQASSATTPWKFQVVAEGLFLSR